MRRSDGRGPSVLEGQVPAQRLRVVSRNGVTVDADGRVQAQLEPPPWESRPEPPRPAHAESWARDFARLRPEAVRRRARWTRTERLLAAVSVGLFVCAALLGVLLSRLA